MLHEKVNAVAREDLIRRFPAVRAAGGVNAIKGITLESSSGFVF